MAKLRKRAVCLRYGGITPKTVERLQAAGRIPPAEYPFGNGTPYWDEQALEINDRAAVLAGRNVAAWRIRFFMS